MTYYNWLFVTFTWIFYFFSITYSLPCGSLWQNL